jgi:hypothetical protein
MIIWPQCSCYRRLCPAAINATANKIGAHLVLIIAKTYAHPEFQQLHTFQL